jgi:hypothetical protein
MIPVFVCSYKRPKAVFLKRSFDYKFPLYVFIRPEEYSDYEYLLQRPNTKLVALRNVTNLGETRRKAIRYAMKKRIPKVFMFDDDITRLDLTQWDNGKARASGTIKGCREDMDMVLRVWESLWDDDIVISGASYRPFAWGMKEHEIDQTKRGQTQQCVGVNVKYLYKHHLNYRSNDLIGSEDLALQFEVMKNGGKAVIMNQIQYDCPAMGVGTGGCCDGEDLITKQHRRIKAFQEYYGEDNRYIVSTARSGVPSIKFNWKEWR